ncbi:MAG: hypothetical protein KDD94_08520 [Calditrichaeota bacterium]|nr:hypothetical protein [Calditrichota bacterium]
MIRFIPFFLLSLLIRYVIKQIRNNKHQKLIQQAFNYIFDPEQFEPIDLKVGNLFGYPTFIITFANQQDYQSASVTGLFDQFNAQLQRIYGEHYQAEQAVIYKYRGQGFF